MREHKLGQKMCLYVQCKRKQEFFVFEQNKYRVAVVVVW